VKLAVNKMHYPVSVLGHGHRVGIWVQGCSIHCSGCCSTDTWEFDQNRALEVETILDWCKEVSVGDLDGFTITGGEPFDQPTGLLALLEAFMDWRESSGRSFDLLVYSGYPMRHIEKQYSAHLAFIDALVPEPFLHEKPTTKQYCGSDNQQIICLTPRARARYLSGEFVDSASGIQVAVDKQGLWMIGIPRRGDLERMERECRKRGLILDGVSWRC